MKALLDTLREQVALTTIEREWWDHYASACEEYFLEEPSEAIDPDGPPLEDQVKADMYFRLTENAQGAFEDEVENALNRDEIAKARRIRDACRRMAKRLI